MAEHARATKPKKNAENDQHPRSPVFFVFAAAFLAAMFLNMLNGGSDSVTITLASAALLTLGVDVGKMIGRR